MTFACDRTDERLTLRSRGTRWLSNGLEGGYCEADAAYNLTVPEGFDRTDLAVYVDERLDGEPPGPTLLTGLGQAHARGVRSGPVEVVATAGLSNPAALPVGDIDIINNNETGERDTDRNNVEYNNESDDRASKTDHEGTVNLFVGTTRALDDGALAGLFATAVEAKAATLLAVAGVPGTTSDALVVGCDPTGTQAAFAGSATEVGAAARACVRDAILASLDSRYDAHPPTLEEAEYRLVTSQETTVFDVDG